MAGCKVQGEAAFTQGQEDGAGSNGASHRTSSPWQADAVAAAFGGLCKSGGATPVVQDEMPAPTSKPNFNERADESRVAGPVRVASNGDAAPSMPTRNPLNAEQASVQMVATAMMVGAQVGGAGRLDGSPRQVAPQAPAVAQSIPVGQSSVAPWFASQVAPAATPRQGASDIDEQPTAGQWQPSSHKAPLPGPTHLSIATLPNGDTLARLRDATLSPQQALTTAQAMAASLEALGRRAIRVYVNGVQGQSTSPFSNEATSPAPSAERTHIPVPGAQSKPTQE